jgi:hypothetical protein
MVIDQFLGTYPTAVNSQAISSVHLVTENFQSGELIAFSI